MCEYEDAHHSGDIVFMKLLRKIMAGNPDSVLTPLVDAQRLDQYIEAYRGHTVAVFDASAFLAQERDFTDFGCRK